MSKELEALKRIRQETCPATFIPDFDKEECCNIIETALKDYERRLALAKEYQDINNVAKRLKALEIIKKLPEEEKQILLNLVYTYTKSEEEYDLLKEVLYE